MMLLTSLTQQYVKKSKDYILLNLAEADLSVVFIHHRMYCVGKLVSRWPLDGSEHRIGYLLESTFINAVYFLVLLSWDRYRIMITQNVSRDTIGWGIKLIGKVLISVGHG